MSLSVYSRCAEMIESSCFIPVGGPLLTSQCCVDWLTFDKVKLSTKFGGENVIVDRTIESLVNRNVTRKTIGVLSKRQLEI